MPQIKSQFTPEQKKAFEEKTNLGVYNHESLIELLMRQEEQINEIAKCTWIGDPTIKIETLYDYWKDTRSMTTEEVMASAIKC